MTLALSSHNFLSHLQFFKVGKIMVPKYGYLMLPGACLDKVTPDINFTGEAVVQYDVPAVIYFCS